MKNFKMIFALVSFLIFANSVVAENQRMRANPDANIEVRSVEDVVKNPENFVSINPGENAKKMSSASLKDKSKTVTALATGIAIDATQATALVQLPLNNKDLVKKYNRFSDKQGEKKNKKNR
ncbi:MAG TPA: hypothetical protein ENJ28_11785 [Gammaproteobacteria bacterium]|nr:hypothetical protein [Gammaproteobacteria bacterium]